MCVCSDTLRMTECTLICQQKKRSVIKLQSMPTGLEEFELLTFFRQFGDVTRVRLKRARYGRSLRYAYVEFEGEGVAKIVADTLSCTSLYGKMLECHEVPPHKVNGAQFFKGVSIEKARKFRKFDNEKQRWTNVSTIANCEFRFAEWHEGLVRDEEAINAHLKEKGVDYEFHGFRELMEGQKGKIGKIGKEEQSDDDDK